MGLRKLLGLEKKPEPKYYCINWDRIKTTEDLIRLLKTFNCQYSEEMYMNQVDEVKDFLTLSRKP